MSVAIWTDSDERITQRHFKPEEVDTSSATAVLDSLPDEPDTEPWEDIRAFYSEQDGVYYEVQNPFEGLNLTNDEKLELYNSIVATNLVKARELIEKSL